MEKKQPLTAKQRFWLEHIKASKAQGVSLSAYAQAQGLKLQTLYDWKWRLGKLGLLGQASQACGFVAVQVKSPVREQGLCRVHLANGVCVEFELAMGEASIGQMLRNANALP